MLLNFFLVQGKNYYCRCVGQLDLAKEHLFMPIVCSTCLCLVIWAIIADCFGIFVLHGKTQAISYTCTALQQIKFGDCKTANHVTIFLPMLVGGVVVINVPAHRM